MKRRMTAWFSHRVSESGERESRRSAAGDRRGLQALMQLRTATKKIMLSNQFRNEEVRQRQDKAKTDLQDMIARKNKNERNSVWSTGWSADAPLPRSGMARSAFKGRFSTGERGSSAGGGRSSRFLLSSFGMRAGSDPLGGGEGGGGRTDGGANGAGWGRSSMRFSFFAHGQRATASEPSSSSQFEEDSYDSRRRRFSRALANASRAGASTGSPFGIGWQEQQHRGYPHEGAEEWGTGETWAELPVHTPPPHDGDTTLPSRSFTAARSQNRGQRMGSLLDSINVADAVGRSSTHLAGAHETLTPESERTSISFTKRNDDDYDGVQEGLAEATQLVAHGGSSLAARLAREDHGREKAGRDASEQQHNGAARGEHQPSRVTSRSRCSPIQLLRSSCRSACRCCWASTGGAMFCRRHQPRGSRSEFEVRI
jgi:hypothetical protein